LASCCSSEAPRLVAGQEIGRSAPEPALVFGFDERKPKSWSYPPQSAICLGCRLVCYLGRAMTDALFALIIYGLPSVRSPPGSSFLDTAAPAMNADALIRAMICAIALVMLILVVLNAARRR